MTTDAMGAGLAIAHIGFAALWLGGPVGIPILLQRLREDGQGHSDVALMQVAAKLGAVAGAANLGALVSGVALSWWRFGSPLSAPAQYQVATLLVFAALLVGLGALKPRVALLAGVSSLEPMEFARVVRQIRAGMYVTKALWFCALLCMFV